MVRVLLKYDAVLPILGTLIIIGGIILNSVGSEESVLQFFSNAHLLEWAAFGPPWLVQLSAGIVATGVAFFLNRFVQSESLMARISNLPFLMICLLFLAVPPEYNHPIFWLGALVQIMVLRQALRIFGGSKVSYDIFNQGLTIGSLAIFNPSFLAYYLISIRALVLGARFDVKKALIIVLAIGMPLYILNGILFLMDQDMVFYSISFSSDWQIEDGLGLIRSGLLLLVFTVAIFQTRSQLSKSTMREKRRWSLVTLALFIGIISIVSFNYGYWFFTLVVPLAIALSHTLIFMKNRWLKEAFFILLLGILYLFKIDA